MTPTGAIMREGMIENNKEGGTQMKKLLGTALVAGLAWPMLAGADPINVKDFALAPRIAEKVAAGESSRTSRI